MNGASETIEYGINLVIELNKQELKMGATISLPKQSYLARLET